MSTPDYSIFNAGDVVLQSGRTFPAMRIAYKTYGTLASDRDNVIVYPTSFAAQHYDTEWLIRSDGILDSSRYFIVVPNLFGNGLSSSPSNTAWPLTGNRYPDVTYHDAVRVQQRLLAEVFGIQRVKMVYGWSMGGMQAYHWAVAFPELVERIAVVCGSSRCAPHNAVFIEGVRAALQACRRPFIASKPGARWASARRRTYWSVAGNTRSHVATPAISWRSSGPGSMATSRRIRTSMATWLWRCARSVPRCC